MLTRRRQLLLTLCALFRPLWLLETLMNRDSDINEIRRELALLKLSHEALLKSHRNLALKTLGDTPEAAVFLKQIQSEIVEKCPDWLKS